MKQKSLIKKLAGYVSFLVGAFAVFGLFLLVQASVPPGSVTAPTFDTSNDVDLRDLALNDCVQRQGTGSTPACPAGYKLTGAGGSCTAGGSFDSQFIPNVALGSVSATCTGSAPLYSTIAAIAYAVCCR